MDKLQTYRTAIDAAVFLLDFMSKENFYSAKLHNDLEDFVSQSLEYCHRIVMDYVTPKVAGNEAR